MFELFCWQKPFADVRTASRVRAALRCGQRPDIGECVLPRYRGKRLMALVESCLRPLPQPMVVLADRDSARVSLRRLRAQLRTLLDDAQK